MAKYNVRFAVMPKTSSQTSMWLSRRRKASPVLEGKFGGAWQASFGGERLDFGLHDLHPQFGTEIAQPQHDWDVHRDGEESHDPNLRLPGVIESATSRRRRSWIESFAPTGADRQQSECERATEPRRHVANQRSAGAGSQACERFPSTCAGSRTSPDVLGDQHVQEQQGGDAQPRHMSMIRTRP